jgi:hypothetical protein
MYPSHYIKNTYQDHGGLLIDSTLEQNSHINNSCARKACCILEFLNKSFIVRSFSSQYDELQDVPIVKAAMAYDAPDGEEYILVLNEALYLGEHIEHSLLCQARAKGILIYDAPKKWLP